MMLIPCLWACLLQTTPPWEPIKMPEAVAGKTLRSVAAIDGPRGLIVGDEGLCLETRDGGRTWTPKSLGTKATLRCVRFLNEKEGLIVGDGDPESPKPTGHIVMGRQMTSGIVLWTEDGGETWRKTYAPTNFELTCAEARGGPVQFGNSGGAAHLDGDVLRSAASVRVWKGTEFKSSRCYRALFDIRAVDAKHWIAVGSAVSVGFLPPPTDPLYTSGPCRALYSQDAGEHWAPAKGSEGLGVLSSLAPDAKGLRILAAGDGGGLLSSQDQGMTWKPVESGVQEDLFAIAWNPRDSEMAVATGDRQTVVVSSDGGQRWKRVSAGSSGALHSVAFFGEHVLVLGDAGLARRAPAKALLSAKPVDAAPPPAKPAWKGPTQTQLDRARVGAVSLYEVALDAPAMKLKADFQKEERITAVSPKGYSVEVEVVKGSPPPGQPAKTKAEVEFESLYDHATWKVGESREETSAAGKVVQTRLADEEVQVAGKPYDCIVVQVKMRSTDGGMVVDNKSWFAKSTEIPGIGFVKEEVTQEMAGPQGKIRISQRTALLGVRRAKE
ncbi:MAG: hypothetical protein JO332_02585 [Planctomycetaceae bacterium]|nr:hypothetical protein [Planctomycetaceae bacterium]